MSKTASRLIALFMLLWLPLSSGSALAASLAMQLQPGNCHESGAMAQHDMSEQQMLRSRHGGADPSGAGATALHLLPQSAGFASNVSEVQHDDQAETANPSSACASCAVCHLACSGFSVAPSHSMQPVVATASIVIFMPEIFISHVSAPLLPPPLARA